MSCSVEGCAKRAESLGLCNMHYLRWKRHGDVGGAESSFQIGCEIDGCIDDHHGLGLCKRHWSRFKQTGIRGDRPTDSERFWSQVDTSGDCWLWTGCLSRHGYGKFAVGSRVCRMHTGAHRFAYVDRVGAIPDGLTLDHLCYVRNCVRPDHLEAVTGSENTRRAWARKRKAS